MYSFEEYGKLAKLDEWLAICVKRTCRLQRLEDVIGKLEKFYGFCIKLIWRECIDELEICYWKIWKVLWLLHWIDLVWMYGRDLIFCHTTTIIVTLFTCFLLRSPLLGDFHICWPSQSKHFCQSCISSCNAKFPRLG